jgi:tRNA (cytidine32/guanosine34-2'-O)-methyltransferase
MGPNALVVPFVACGDLTGYDADKSYPLQLENEQEYVYHDPVQPPVHPNYYTYQQKFKTNN